MTLIPDHSEKYMDNVIDSILQSGVDPTDRRMWIRAGKLPALWRYISDNFPESTTCAMLYYSLALLVYCFPKEKRDDVLSRVMELLPILHDMLSMGFVSGADTRAEADKKRKEADKLWKDLRKSS